MPVEHRSPLPADRAAPPQPPSRLLGGMRRWDRALHLHEDDLAEDAIRAVETVETRSHRDRGTWRRTDRTPESAPPLVCCAGCPSRSQSRRARRPPTRVDAAVHGAVSVVDKSPGLSVHSGWSRCRAARPPRPRRVYAGAAPRLAPLRHLHDALSRCVLARSIGSPGGPTAMASRARWWTAEPGTAARRRCSRRAPRNGPSGPLTPSRAPRWRPRPTRSRRTCSRSPRASAAARRRSCARRSRWSAPPATSRSGRAGFRTRSSRRWARSGRSPILHLDGDWYESIRFPLETLYPLVSPGGWIVIDDYGAVHGAARATDEFRARAGDTSPLVTIDQTGRYWRKPR